MKQPWTYEGYWNVVFGDRTEDRVVEEFDLSDAPKAGHGSIDEWLGTAEVEAWRAGGIGGDMPDEWSEYHARALRALKQAAARPNKFLSMTDAEILHYRVEQLVNKWGEAERDASLRMESGKSRGLLLNSIAVHDVDNIDTEAASAAKACLTADDRAQLRQGG